jgi:hypothetical protein
MYSGYPAHARMREPKLLLVEPGGKLERVMGIERTQSSSGPQSIQGLALSGHPACDWSVKMWSSTTPTGTAVDNSHRKTIDGQE